MDKFMEKMLNLLSPEQLYTVIAELLAYSAKHIHSVEAREGIDFPEDIVDDIATSAKRSIVEGL